MTSKPSPATSKSMDSLNNFLWSIKNLSQGHERQLRSAFYNIFVIAAIGIIVAVHLVLGPFLKPLLWAFLFGAVLFPFKRRISFWLNSWFEDLERNDRSLFLGIAVVPFKTLDSLGEYCGTWLKENVKLLAGGFIGVIAIRILISLKSHGLFCLLWRGIYWSHEVFTTVLNLFNWTILLAIIVLYITCVFLLWKPENSVHFTISGQILWMIVVAYICSFLGALQIPAFCIAILYGIIGLGYDIRTRLNLKQDDSLVQNISNLIDVKTFYKQNPKAIEDNDRNDVETETNKTNNPLNITELNLTTVLDASIDDGGLESDTYFIILFYACAATIFYKNTWLVIFLTIPLLIYFFNKLCISFGIWKFVFDKLTVLWNSFFNWIIERHSALLPICLPGILQINTKVHLAIRDYLKSSIDVVSSIIMIILLIFIASFASVFFCVQIYSETFAVVQLGSDLINRTLTARPDLVQMLPEGYEGSMNNVLDNAHHYGRENIETYVDNLFKDTEPEQAKKFKNQILLVWDRLIQNWLDRTDSIGPKVPSSAITDSIDEIVDNPELISAAKQGITEWAKTNLGMIMEVVDSLWIIIRNNMYLLGSIFGTIFSMILGGGHAVITFIVNTIIFFTSLFYLLSSSEDRYAGLAAVEALGSSMGAKIAVALENSISCVIIATLKLALFHGLFTWLTHTWFGAHVVFLPAAIAAVLAAAPFLGTYWCSVPAVLDLWLSQDRLYMGVLLFLIHFIIPSSFVDPTIISEIKGAGHPYLTGLSIAGGMFWLGLEGAILGPLFLCCLVVIFDLSTKSLKESPSFVARTPHNIDRDRLVAEMR